MNKDQVKGRLKEAAGETQEQAGKLTGNAHQQAKGHAREQAGKIQKNMGDARHKLEKEADKLDD